MSTHAKAVSAGSTERSNGKRRLGSLLVILALALCALGSGASAASAAPTISMESVSDVGYGSAIAKGKVKGDGFTFWSFEYSSDGGATWSGFGFEGLYFDTEQHTVEANLAGLEGGTSYEVRLAAGPGFAEVFSAGPNPDFTTLPSDPPAVLAVDNAANVFSTTAEASGEVERPADPDPLLDAHPAVDVKCNFEYVTDDQFNATGFEGAGVTPCDPPNPVEAPGASAVSAKLSGLTPSTTYHLRLSGKNAGGFDSKEAAATFTTAPQVAAPSVLSVDPASEVAYTTAKLSGEVERPAGEDPQLNTTCRFEYIADAQYDENESNSQPPFSGANPVPCNPETIPSGGAVEVESALSGLTVGTEYHQRLVVENGGGSDAEEGSSFTTLSPTAPTVTIDPASSVTATGASFSGHVTAGGTDPVFSTNSCAFEYATDPRNERQRLDVSASGGTYRLTFEGQESTAIPYDAGAPEIQSALEALSTIGSGNVAVGGGGGIHPYVIVFGGDLATKDVEQLIGRGGFFDPSGNFFSTLTGNVVVTTGLQGQAPGFAGAHTAPCDVSPVTGTGETEVKADVSGLEPGTTYHLRLRATNLGGTGSADAADFTTETAPPTIIDTATTDITKTSATLNAEINPGGAATTFHFEYLTLKEFNDASGSFAGATPTSESTSIGADNEGHAAVAAITGLTEDTAYRYRVVAENSNAPGGIAGPVRSFHTQGTTVAEPESCPNTAVREQQTSTYLPECRAYEIVNPPTLDFGEVNRVSRISDDGEIVAFQSPLLSDISRGGAISGTYVARRTPSGWVTHDANFKPTGSIIAGTGAAGPLTFSPDFSRELISTTYPADPGDINNTVDIYRVEVGTGTTTWMSRTGEVVPERYFGASKNLDRMLFRYESGPEEVLLSGLYASDGTNLELISRYPNGDPLPDNFGGASRPAGGAYRYGLGVGEQRKQDVWLENGGDHAVSDDARRVYFTDLQPGTHGHTADTYLYLRDLTGPLPVTIPVSASQRTGEVGVMYDGTFISATHDGSVAFFVSSNQLTDESDPGGGIYRFDREAPEGQRLEQITPDSGEPEEGLKLPGAIASDDQSHLYFTSGSVLDSGAEAGAGNLYVWTEVNGVRFIASAGSGDRFSRVSRDGRYALMLTSVSIDGAPNHGQKALYEYDYDNDEMLCVSCRTDGSPSKGTAEIEAQSSGLPGGAITHPAAVTDDGRVFFDSTDRLVAADQTPAQDVYMYDKGKISLISSGKAPEASFLGANSDDGRNVFIYTRSALVGADRDAQEFDVYDARVGGGFLEPPPPAAPCEGEACRGAGTNPPSTAGAVTPSLIGPGNPKPCAKGKVRRNSRCVKPHKHRKHQKKHGGRKHKRDANANGRTGR